MRDADTNYEPRALWSVQRLSNEAGEALCGRFEREHFRNGGRYPIELRHILIAPVGYVLSEYAGNGGAGLGNLGACAAIIQRARLMISVPARQHYALEPLRVSSWGLRAISPPQMRHSADPHASEAFGVYRWDFPKDRRMAMPRNAAATFQLGTYAIQPDDGALGASVGTPGVRATIAVNEEGAGHHGSRAFPWNAHARTAAFLEVGETPDPAVHPFQPADGLGASVGGNGPPEEWPSQSQLRFRDYKLQEAARAGYNEVTGFAVALDQTALDEQLQTLAIANVAGSPVAPLGHRLPTRARADCGSQQWWWREGAPLSLVSPSHGPALVYDLPRPLWLHPGDTLELEMEIPPAPGDATTESIFQVGVSFCGYAMIRGV